MDKNDHLNKGHPKLPVTGEHLPDPTEVSSAFDNGADISPGNEVKIEPKPRWQTHIIVEPLSEPPQNIRSVDDLFEDATKYGFLDQLTDILDGWKENGYRVDMSAYSAMPKSELQEVRKTVQSSYRDWRKRWIEFLKRPALLWEFVPSPNWDSVNQGIRKHLFRRKNV